MTHAELEHQAEEWERLATPEQRAAKAAYVAEVERITAEWRAGCAEGVRVGSHEVARNGFFDLTERLRAIPMPDLRSR
jgi:hypothetical protein